MLIRDVKLSDARDITAIYRRYVTDNAVSFELEPPDEVEMARRIAKVTKEYPWIVMEEDGDVLGYAYAGRFRERKAYDPTSELSVYVADVHHRKGIGKALVEELIERLKKMGIYTVIAGVTLPNPGSVALVESFGFRHVGTFENVGRKFGKWYSVAMFSMSIRDYD